MMPRLISLLPLALVLSSCLSIDGPDNDFIETLAVLESGAFSENVSAPATAQRNIAFNVTFTTYGSSCGETTNEVVITGLDVHIIPTYRVRRDAVCPDVLVQTQNVVPVRVIIAGPAVVYVHGLRQPQNEEIVVTRPVTIEQ